MEEVQPMSKGSAGSLFSIFASPCFLDQIFQEEPELFAELERRAKSAHRRFRRWAQYSSGKRRWRQLLQQEFVAEPFEVRNTPLHQKKPLASVRALPVRLGTKREHLR